MDQAIVFILCQAEALVGKIASENTDARLQMFIESLEVQMQLERVPEAFLGFLRSAGAD
jgi:hypothetical protein